MDRDIWLLIAGALIGFVGSTLSTFISYVLENKRTKRQWQREDFLRAESRRQEELKLAQNFNLQSNLKNLSTILRDPHGEYCFLPETRITLSSHQVVPIENIKVGDSLLSYDLDEEKKFEGIVTEIKKSEVESYVIINGAIKVTSSHLFWTKEGWKRAGKINLQDELYDMNGDYLSVSKLETVNKSASVYNLELINDVPFFAENVLVNTFTGKRSEVQVGSVSENQQDEEVVEIDEFGKIHNAK